MYSYFTDQFQSLHHHLWECSAIPQYEYHQCNNANVEINSTQVVNTALIIDVINQLVFKPNTVLLGVIKVSSMEAATPIHQAIRKPAVVVVIVTTTISSSSLTSLPTVWVKRSEEVSKLSMSEKFISVGIWSLKQHCERSLTDYL